MFDPNLLDVPAVIFDNVSGLFKAGIAGDSGPKSVFTAIKVKATMLGAGQKECYIGEEAQSKRGVPSLNYPIDHGIVTCWDDMERIWRHVYEYELRRKPVKGQWCCLKPPSILSNREKMTETMFEGFMVPAMYVVVRATLALYASARITGIVMDGGDGVTHTSPHMKDTVYPMLLDITKYFMKLLLESRHTFASTAKREIVRDIKQKLCYIGNQLFRAPETLLVPANIGVEAPGVHKMIFNSTVKCDVDVRRNLYGSILL
ncbi:LOW QUALITY PROTEIN: hypothetical protein QYF61_006534 [Mycteria americana]|uniref:Actin n=1 Tax=Mycteria americana TaxID=33587 RepID=A0AAN7RJT9_MYCAM|nr:LOW QUALITY PROTEIN: hypothetical protein QYF61_006534 [Mycteria americana]